MMLLPLVGAMMTLDAMPLFTTEQRLLPLVGAMMTGSSPGTPAAPS